MPTSEATAVLTYRRESGRHRSAERFSGRAVLTLRVAGSSEREMSDDTDDDRDDDDRG